MTDTHATPPTGAPSAPGADSTSTTPSAQEVAARLGQEGQTRSTLDALIGEAGKAIAWLVLVSAAISVYEVVMRYAFNNPTSWVHETTVFLIAVIFALGGPVAMARDKHIRVRLIYDAVSPRTRRWLDMVNSVITFIFLTGMTFAAWVMFYNSTHAPTGIIQLERSGTSWNPPFPAWIKTVILISVAVMLVQTILHFIKAARGEGYEDGHPTAATDLGPGGDAAKTEG